MTVDHLREQLKARRLFTNGNKKTLATRLNAHLEQTAFLPCQRGEAGTISRRTAARQRELSKDQFYHRSQGGPSREKSRSRSRSPISSRRARSTGRQRGRQGHSRSQRRSRRRTPSASSRSESSDNDAAEELGSGELKQLHPTQHHP